MDSSYPTAVEKIEGEYGTVGDEFEACLDALRRVAITRGKRPEHESLRLRVDGATWLIGWVDESEIYLRVNEGNGWIPVYEGKIVVPVECLVSISSQLDKLLDSFNDWCEMPKTAQKAVGSENSVIDTCSDTSYPDSISNGSLFNTLQESIATLYTSILSEREADFEGMRAGICSGSDVYLSHVLATNTLQWREISKWFSTCSDCEQEHSDIQLERDGESMRVTVNRCPCQDDTSPIRWEIHREESSPTGFEVVGMFSDQNCGSNPPKAVGSQKVHLGHSGSQESFPFLIGTRYEIAESCCIERVTNFRNHLEWRIENKAEYYFGQIDQWAREKASSKVSDKIRERLRDEPLLNEMSWVMNDDPLEAPTLSITKTGTEELKELQKAVGITEDEVRETFERLNKDDESYFSYSRLTANARRQVVFSKLNEQYVNEFNSLVEQYIGEISVSKLEDCVRESVVDEFSRECSAKYTRQVGESVLVTSFPVVKSSQDSFVVPCDSDAWISIRRRDRRPVIGPLPPGRYRIYSETEEAPVEDFLYHRSWEYSQSRSPRSPRNPVSDRPRFQYINNSVW